MGSIQVGFFMAGLLSCNVGHMSPYCGRIPNMGRLPVGATSIPQGAGRRSEGATDDMVPEVGLEPTRCCHRRILNPVRLPVPPLRHQLQIDGRRGTN